MDFVLCLKFDCLKLGLRERLCCGFVGFRLKFDFRLGFGCHFCLNFGFRLNFRPCLKGDF